jgi:hypothetical protein
MGLDQYAFITSNVTKHVVDFPQTCDDEKLHYWRKHPDLHGWMEKLYFSKGGVEESFNLSSVRLDLNDLDRLERDVRQGRLPETNGFFFGASDGSEREDDLEFIIKARRVIASGRSVYYFAWW